MTSILRRTFTIGGAILGLAVLSPGTAVAAGPQPLPDAACSLGSQVAAQHAPNRTAAEAIPHIEHAYPVPVPYCHHFNPTATPPPAP